MTDLVLTALSERWPELVAALVFTFLGTRWSRLMAHIRLRSWLAKELVATQRAMRDRAAPVGGWSKDGARELWMLEPYTRRVEFLSTLAHREGLGTKVETTIDGYLNELNGYIAAWSGAKYRGGDFQKAYTDTWCQLERSLRVLHRLGPYKQELERLQSYKAASTAKSEASGSTSLDPLDAGATDTETISDSDLGQSTAQ